MTMAMTMLALPPRHPEPGPLEVLVDVCLKPKCSLRWSPNLDIAHRTTVSRTLHTSPRRTVIAERWKQSGGEPHRCSQLMAQRGLPAAAQKGTTG